MDGRPLESTGDLEDLIFDRCGQSCLDGARVWRLILVVLVNYWGFELMKDHERKPLLNVEREL